MLGKVGVEAVRELEPMVKELLARIDKLTLEVQAVRAILEQKRIVIQLEDKP